MRMFFVFLLGLSCFSNLIFTGIEEYTDYCDTDTAFEVAQEEVNNNEEMKGVEYDDYTM